MSCQAHYHASLEGRLQGDLRIIKGYHDARPARAHRWEEGKAARECDKVDIWKLEEKQSDVALALHAYSDAIRKKVDQIIVLTNDTDFAPAVRMIPRTHAGHRWSDRTTKGRARHDKRRNPEARALGTEAHPR
jgi:6-hydroxy-3-succinoylpyridine 3-monooxygenase